MLFGCPDSVMRSSLEFLERKLLNHVVARPRDSPMHQEFKQSNLAECHVS